MDAGGDSKCNVDVVTGPVTNISQPPSPSTKEVHENTNNNHLEVNSPAVGNNEDPITLSSSSTQNSFISQTDATDNTATSNMNSNTSNTSVSGSLDEKTNTNNNDSDGAFESLQNQQLTCETISTNVESHNPIQEECQGVNSTTHLGTLSSPSFGPSDQEHVHASIDVTNKETPKLELASHANGESSNVDIPTSSMPNHEHSDHVAVQNSTSVSPSQDTEHDMNKEADIQNPRVQVMERPSESGASIDVTNKETPNLELASHANGESSNVDIPFNSMPNHEHSDHVAVQNSTPVSPSKDTKHDMNEEADTQNPQVQVMERPSESGASIDVTNKETPNLELASHAYGESSSVDISIGSMPNHEHSDSAAGQNSTPVSPSQDTEHDMNREADIQNPQVQVMERPNESGATSQYVFPSHVFARNNTNTPEWSTASNESLFSIYMGNMSFSSELACFKSCELDKPGDITMPDQPNTSPNQPNTPLNHQPPTPANKFNDISQRTAELHEEGLRVTEAKAAETMREVIMESSRTTENVVKKEDKRSHSRRQSDGSTKSYAFQTSTDRDKNLSSNGAGEKQTPQKMSDQNEKTKGDDQEPKANTNAPPNKWLSCFSCCSFC